MRIGLNLLYLIPDRVGGTQTYAESLLDSLAKLDTQNEYDVFVNQEAETFPLPDVPHFRRVVCPCRATSRFARYAWEQFVFPGWLNRERIDLVHSLGYVCPFFPGRKSVVSIHDVNYIGLGRAMPRLRRWMLRFFVPWSARRADYVIAMSHFTKDQIVRFTNVSTDKVSVTHEAPGVRQADNAESIDWDDLAHRYRLKTPYLVAFSSQSAHKNISRLLKAYAQVLKHWPDLEHDLVLLGHLPPGSPLPQEIERLGLKERVVSTGYVPDEHVLPLLQHGQVFAFPSWYEGFGLPVLEAQKAGLPLVCSRAASIPEVAGDGAIYFSPYSVDEMADALEKLLRDQTLRADLIEKGRANLDRFSWDETARQTLAVYESVMKK